MPILNWLTRDEDVHASRNVPYRLLEEVPELSYGDKDTGNMLIQGDNLEALKALPYCMVMMDEIFGRKNRISVCTFKQSSVSGPKSVNPGVVSICSFVMLYAKNKATWKSNKVYRPRGRDPRYASFIQNRFENIKNWTVVSLSLALEKEFGLPIKKIREKFNVRYEEKVHQFVIRNKNAVIRTARVKPKDIREDARPVLENSLKESGRFFIFSRKNYPDPLLSR